MKSIINNNRIWFILERKWKYNGTVYQLFIDFKKAYDSVRRIRIGKHLSGEFPIKNGLKQGDALSPLRFNFALEYVIRKVQ
jgi:hypothetical protein